MSHSHASALEGKEVTARHEAGSSVDRLRSSDLMRQLASIEAAYPVQEWAVAGVPIWPLVRLRWFFAEWARLYTAAPSATGAGSPRAVLRSMLAGAKKRATAIREDQAHMDDDRAERDLVFLSDGISFARLGNEWVERFCDPVAQCAQQHGLTTALWTPLHEYHHPRARPSTWVQPTIDRANLAGAFRARILAPSRSLPGLDAVTAACAREGMGVQAFSPERIASDAARVRSVSTLHKKRLEATKPKLALLVSYYSLEGMAFVYACHELGVPVADLQHGVQGEWHPAYAAWPSPGPSRVHMLLPDAFWVWSDWEASVIERWSAGSAHFPLVGGNPWLDVWSESGASPGVVDSVAAARALRNRAQGRPVVLVTLQFGLAAHEQLEPLGELLRLVGDRLAFWVRLHPAMLERREEVRQRLDRAGQDYVLDPASDLPLQALLVHASAHLTHSSSTVIEAAQLGVRSVITSRYGMELFTPLVTRGFAVPETGDSAQLSRTLLSLVERHVNTATPATVVHESQPASTWAALKALLAHGREGRETSR